MSTGAWLVDTFGPLGPLVVMAVCLLFLAIHWIFLRPRLVAWVRRDPELKEKRLRVVLGIGLILSMLSFLLVFTAD